MKLDKDGKWRVQGYLHPRTYAWVIDKKWDAGKAPWWLIKRYCLACVAWERDPTVYVKSVEYDGMILKAMKASVQPNKRPGSPYYGL